MKRVRSQGLALVTLLVACATARPQPAGLEQWQVRHPEASTELGAWVRAFPDAAGQFFEWDAHHTERAHEFVTWTIRYPGQPVDAFVATHPGWRGLDGILLTYRPGAEAFMAWCRRHPEAAEDLMSHPGGLQWAGHHLYQESWYMEHPGY
jgi:hypothetical protein